jgi:hypothetical protein
METLSASKRDFLMDYQKEQKRADLLEFSLVDPLEAKQIAL